MRTLITEKTPFPRAVWCSPPATTTMTESHRTKKMKLNHLRNGLSIVRNRLTTRKSFRRCACIPNSWPAACKSRRQSKLACTLPSVRTDVRRSTKPPLRFEAKSRSPNWSCQCTNLQPRMRKMLANRYSKYCDEDAEMPVENQTTSSSSKAQIRGKKNPIQEASSLTIYEAAIEGDSRGVACGV